MSVQAFYGEANALYWTSFKRQNSTHLALLKHQNSKTALYKLPKNHWVIALFEISGPVRNKSLVTVSLDHSVSSDSDTKYFLSHDSNVISYHQWKTFQVVVTDDVYPPTRLCWCNYTRGCQAVVTWCNVQHAGCVNLIDIPIVGRWQSIEFSVIWTCELQHDDNE